MIIILVVWYDQWSILFVGVCLSESFPGAIELSLMLKMKSASAPAIYEPL